ncbi:MAG: hypothetical protein AAFO04_07435 [Cyanobacteria bacterium J06592_8]
MQKVYIVQANDLDIHFLEELKSIFRDQEIEIAVTDVTLDLQEVEDIDQQEWLQALASNPVFDFLKDSEEDIYTLSDGKRFND